MYGDVKLISYMVRAGELSTNKDDRHSERVKKAETSERKITGMDKLVHAGKRKLEQKRFLETVKIR